MKTMHLTAVIWPEGKKYVSSCPEIGVSSFGRTPVAARDALQEAVELWLDNAKELGLLGDVAVALESKERYTAPLEVAV